MNTTQKIHTDATGKPIPKPERADFATDVDYLHAFYAWRDEIARVANSAFDSAFRATLRA